MIHAPTSTKNQHQQQDPEMRATRKGAQAYFGIRAHMGVDAHSGLVHHGGGTGANVSNVTLAHRLLHGQETEVYGEVNWQTSAPRLWLPLGPAPAMLKAHHLKERAQTKIRAKVVHAFRVVKCPFGFRKVRYQGLLKSTALLFTLFTLANLRRVRKPCLMP